MSRIVSASISNDEAPFPFDKLRVRVHPFVELVETNIPENSPQHVPEDDGGHCTSYFESFTMTFSLLERERDEAIKKGLKETPLIENRKMQGDSMKQSMLNPEWGSI